MTGKVKDSDAYLQCNNSIFCALQVFLNEQHVFIGKSLSDDHRVVLSNVISKYYRAIVDAFDKVTEEMKDERQRVDE